MRAAISHHFEEAAARVIILAMRFQVRRQFFDSLAQNRHLNSGGAGIGLMQAMLFYQALLFLFGNHKRRYLLIKTLTLLILAHPDQICNIMI